jgi:hypothetical protein
LEEQRTKNISQLQLGVNQMTSEPNTALLLKEDRELNRLGLLHPNQNFQTISEEDLDSRKARNQKIDEMYEMNHSAEQWRQKDEQISKFKFLAKIESSDIFPPKLGQKLNLNFTDEEIKEQVNPNRSAVKNAVDEILHQTPDVHVSLESKMSKIKEIFEQKSETPIKEKVE